MMIDVQYKTIRNAGILYLALPLVIFFAGWLAPVWAAVFSAVLAGAVFFFIKNTQKDDFFYDSLSVSLNKIIIIALIALLWCLVAGQGGFFHQSADHEIRNMIIKDMVRYPWPVTYENNKYMLCYYIVHWMLPSLFGKIVYTLSGSAQAAYLVCNIILYLWSSVGCFITLMLFAVMTCRRDKVRVIFSVIIFIFFSGADVATTYINFYEHIEWGTSGFQYSSNMTLLFWVYNQSIAAWIASLCIFNEKKIKNFAFIALMAFPYAPLPFMGIFFICIVRGFIILFTERKNTKPVAFLKQAFSLQNVLSALSSGIVFILYFSANMVAAGEDDTGFRLHEAFASPYKRPGHILPHFWSTYLVFIFTAFVIYALLLWYDHKKDVLFYFVIGSLFIIPVLQIGVSYDFCMRVSIPSLTYLCVLVARSVQEKCPPKETVIAIVKESKKRSIIVGVFVAVIFVWLYTHLGERLILTPLHRIIIPAVVLVMFYGSFYIQKKQPSPDPKSFFSTYRLKLNPLFVGLVVLLFIGSITGYKEIRRETLLTFTKGSNFSYQTNDSLEGQRNLNFMAEDYQQSAFYRLIGKK